MQKRKWAITPQLKEELEVPFGYSKNTSEIIHKEEIEKLENLKEKKSWEFANAPRNQIFMQAFLLYISGNQINIFPIIITFMTIFNPLKAIFSIQETFSSFKNATIQKILFVLWNLVIVLLGIYKLHLLGLLPSQSDFININVPEFTEYSLNMKI
jgi:ER membrane protein complex subunit 4